MESFVDLICVNEHNKLRVKITTPGYLNTANVQFPRDLRIEGRRFRVPSYYVTLITMRGKYFYSIKKRDAISIVDNIQQQQIDTSNIKVFEDTETTECTICFCNEKTIVFNPCGHYYTCGECSNKVSACPICRVKITARIDRNLIQ